MTDIGRDLFEDRVQVEDMDEVQWEKWKFADGELGDLVAAATGCQVTVRGFMASATAPVECVAMKLFDGDATRGFRVDVTGLDLLGMAEVVIRAVRRQMA